MERVQAIGFKAAYSGPSSSPLQLAVWAGGEACGFPEGTGPDDDPWLRAERDEVRAEGRADLVRAVAGILEARRLAASSSLRERLTALADVPADKLIRAARECASEEDLLRRLRR